MKYMEYVAPAAFVLLSLICIVFLHWNAFISIVLGAATGAGISYVQHNGLKMPEGAAKKECAEKKPEGEKVEKKAEEKAEEKKEEKGEKPVFKEGEEPEHFHDNDELAAKAGVHRDKARQLRDDAHKPENRERKGELLDEADKEDATASKMIFEELQKKQPEGTIDLHLQFVAEAVRICDEQAEILKGKGATEMIVITGKGNHSEGGKCKIAPAIENWANEHGYSQEPGEGKITVRF